MSEGRSDRIPMRPDHGHALGDEIGKPGVDPGYSFGSRLKGLAELRGVMHALESLRRSYALLTLLHNAARKPSPAIEL